MIEDIKKFIQNYIDYFLIGLLILQPLLDVLSFFMIQNEFTILTTVIRAVILFLVSLTGFILSDQKRKYVLLYVVLAAFWIIHVVNCMRYGYMDPWLDLGEYLKLIQLPLWFFSFVTIFKQNEYLQSLTENLMALNFCIIIGIILLSFITRNPVYTYDYPDRGVQLGLLGWFGVANAQSAIIAILVPWVILWGMRKRNLLIISICTLAGISLLYFTGTRLTYYAAIIICLAFIVLIIANNELLIYCAPFLLALILLFALKGLSPMAQRQALTADSYAVYQEKTDIVMGDDKDFVYDKNEKISDSVMEKVEKVYSDVYSGKGIYGNTLLGDLIDRFGIEKVMEVYDYSIEPEVLYNVRTKRLKCVELIFSEKDILARLFGFEYKETYINNVIFDPENDFPAVFAFYGIVGGGLYLALIAYILFICLRELVFDFPGFLSLELGTAAMTFVLALGAAQFSGQVLRKPSVVIYIAISAAIIYLNVYRPSTKKSNVFVKNTVVTIKKL